ncbi:hypothetical protein [Mycobacterium sp. 1465703.0]|uniref:hypothetical protein n=1 Tax=Mycobacterium sp. 1465703.0 TaxID=1834078 RepID=UPI0007FD16E7|nr:hypothetical protein [Mycobacterium sp. 1465703.0]OBJ10843.1 hypothetical protein A5625_10250 [Mycobacterium sp. 1465703.0]
MSQACGLPGPVIMQLVPRTWVEPVGWLYTVDQINAAIAISEDLRRPSNTDPEAAREPIQTLSCQRCAALTPVADADVRGWLNVVDPDSRMLADLDGKDYCGECVMACPSCSTADSDPLCETCLGTRRVPRPPLSTNFVQSPPEHRPYR